MRYRVLLGALGVALLVPLQAGAEPVGDLERDLDETTGEADDAAEDLDDVRARRETAEEELAQIGARLADARSRRRQAENQVAMAEQALAEAREAREEATEDHEQAQERLEEARRALERETARLEEQVVEGFKYGSSGATRGAMALEMIRRAEDPNSFAVGMKQLGTVAEAQDETVQRVIELREARAEREEEAARARSRASQAAADAAETLETVEELRARAAELAEEVAAEREAQQEAVAALRANEQEAEQVLARVSERQEELEAEIRSRRAEQERQERQEAAAEDAEGAQGRGGGPDVSGGHCPVQGAVAGRDFSNDWGYPRSGGRRHEGTDIFADRGRPVIAIDDGTVVRMNRSESGGGLGGITVTYRTGDGSEWYNAHLDGVASGLSVGSSVSAGQQVGTVGDSGNARGTPPHLHLGRYVNGDAVNPYPTISELCR